MKRILNMKRYDTEKSEMIAKWDNGGHRRDFRRCEETLYRTRNGNWFLHGEGGPFSQYASTCEAGRTKTDGEELIPFTVQQAAAWLAEHDVEAFERHFPEKAQDA
ncbi:MAG: hypothetical protein ABSH34_29545 [Verrucomicrobiota bacterium]|jgi:hypothetical protein